MPRIAVVGAGLSGLMCARTLVEHDFDVTVFEKSRGVGGRMSTRRVNDDLHFDHGAQYFTVRDVRFARQLKSWQKAGIVQRWKGRIGVIGRSAATEFNDGPERFVATPGMNAICKHLAQGLKIELETCIQPIASDKHGWNLTDEHGRQLGQFDFVVVSAPAAQTATILEQVPALAEKSLACEMEPCWALMIAVDSALALEYDGAFVHNSPLSWIARNSSKPKRNTGETWVLHATPSWSRERPGVEREVIGNELLSAFESATGLNGIRPTHSTAHFWRYAIPLDPLQQNVLIDETVGVAVCGDWCAGARVEGAFISGCAAGDRILGLLARR